MTMGGASNSTPSSTTTTSASQFTASADFSASKSTTNNSTTLVAPNTGLPGGGSTGGGGSGLGGGTSAGGSESGGGGTTGGAANTASPSTANGTTSSDQSLTGLTINSSSGSMMGTSVVSGTRQAPRPTPQSVGIVRLRDVARVEMGAQNYNQFCTFDGKPSVGLAVFQLPGTNALDVADNIKKKMADLKTRFPDGIDYTIAYDITPFVRESVNDVVHTLLEAIVLVGLVVLVFLQNWRAVLIPLIAVPVAIVGTFAAMAALNFSLNNISLFGLVLANSASSSMTRSSWLKTSNAG